MRMSQYFLPLLKETPAEAELVSHRYMLRAGLIRRLSKGVYTWLPLGLRVLRRVEAIVRQEMQETGAQELLMPMVQPATLWEESGRWQQYGAELLRLEDRHLHAHCLGPTHEEVITDLIRHTVSSYKQLPLTLFQIQTKFRDEIRPRFGVMRSREFMMKDAYSFHTTTDSLDETYTAMRAAYERIFQRLGLNYRVVLADSGSIGGEFSHEFHVLADSGEDTIVFSDGSDYAANLEKANSLQPVASEPASQLTIAAHETVKTPNIRTIEELCKFMSCTPAQTVKTILVRGTEVPWVALLLRGDDELNPLKAEKIPEVAAPLQLAGAASIAHDLPCEAGFFGPGLSIPTYMDHAVAALPSFICGANRNHEHVKNVVWGRDLEPPPVADLRLVQAGDLSPDGAGKLHFKRGIEVGHIFKLGTKYSDMLSAKVLNEAGQGVSLNMGCYGIGISRIVAAAIEQQHDTRGIIWPANMAPFQVHLLPLMAHKSHRVSELAQQVYKQLQDQGIEVLWEDTKLRPGVMLAQADLLGIPHRLVISERGLDQQTVEYKARSADEAEIWPLSEWQARLQACVLVTTK